jgi:hypothetical protein
MRSSGVTLEGIPLALTMMVSPSSKTMPVGFSNWLYPLVFSSFAVADTGG